MTTESKTSVWRYASAGLAACLIAGAAMSPASAALIGFVGGASSAGANAQIIAAPLFAQNSMVFNSGQQGFDERQNVNLGAALDTDAGIGAIAAGITVDSHMIFLNKQDGVSGNLNHFNVEWTFDGQILGVMSDQQGNLESASTLALGAPGTTYEAPFNARGMEGSLATKLALGGGPANDGYAIINPFTIRVGMNVSQPGDWIRVVTAHVPVPGAVWMFLSAIGGLGLFGWRRRRMAAA